MAEELPDELRDWGPIQGVVWSDLKWNWFIRIGLAVVIVGGWVLSIALLTMDMPKADPAHQKTVVTASVWIMVLVTLVGSMVIWYFHRTSDTRVIVLTKGLATVRGGKVTAIPYSEITEIEVKPMPILGADYSQPSGWTEMYVIHRANGDLMRINGNHYARTKDVDKWLRALTQSLPNPPRWIIEPKPEL